MPGALLDKTLISKLERLEISFRRAQRGLPEGGRSSPRHGGRIEFADYRQYSPGDDFRHVDWNVLSRTGEIFVKEFEREERYLIYLLVDKSASMAFPESGSTKYEYAAACAAALGYIGLCAGHQIETCAFNADCTWYTAGADKKGIFGLIDFLSGMRPEGMTALAPALQKAYERAGEKCLVVLFSDLLDEGRAQQALAALASRGCDISVVQILSRDEIEPQARGRVLFRDAETGTAVPMQISDADAAAYREELRGFGERWSAFCGKHDIRFLSTATDVPFEDFVMDYLRRGGLVR